MSTPIERIREAALEIQLAVSRYLLNLPRRLPEPRRLVTKAGAGNSESKRFDVFLSYNDADRERVQRIARRLTREGLKPWLAEWEVRPGETWQKVLDQELGRINSAAVFLGSEGLGRWQELELGVILKKFVDSGRPVIPVLLPGFEDESEIPEFLQLFQLVDYRREFPDPFLQLVWGITGKRSGGQPEH